MSVIVMLLNMVIYYAVIVHVMITSCMHGAEKAKEGGACIS